MSTAQLVTLALIIFFGMSFVFCLFVGRFFKAGRGPDTSDADNMAFRMGQLKETQNALIAEMVAEIQGRLADNRAILADLYTVPSDPEVIRHRAMVYGDIMDDERQLHALRGKPSGMVTAANVWEGRM